MAGNSIGTLKAFLTLDTQQWMAGFGSAQKAASGFVSGVGSKLVGAMTGIGKSVALAGFSAVTAGFSFHEMMESLGNVGALAGTAKKLGITVEELQRLQFAAAKSGVDLETLANGLLLMGKNIGSGGQSLDKRFMNVADAFTQIKDAGERAKFSRDVFGKGGFDFINLLSKGSAGIRQSADAIDKFGLAIKDIDAAKAKEALIALKELKEVTAAYKDKLTIEVAPALNNFFSEQLKWLERIVTTVKWLEDHTPFGGRKDVAGAVGTVLGGGYIGAAIDSYDKMFGKKKGGASAIGGPTAGGGSAAVKSLGFAGALEKGSVAAQSAITNANASPFSGIEKNTKETVDKLTLIERNTAAAARKQSGTPLRPSNLRGGGAK